jgi:hypothetical protein
MEKYIGNRDQFGADVLRCSTGPPAARRWSRHAQRLRRVVQREYAQLRSNRLPVHSHHAHGRAPHRRKTVSWANSADVRLATTLRAASRAQPAGDLVPASRPPKPAGSLQIVGRPFDKC